MSDQEREVMESLDIVRESGKCNMFDTRCVQEQLAELEGMYLKTEDVRKYVLKYME